MNIKHLTRKDLSALVPQYPSNFISKKSAFTLAEVLITLGIIDIVAALTLPTLIANYQEKVWINQFKASYSILSQAYVQAYNDYGLLEDWGLNAATDKENNYKAAKILTSYIKPAQDYGQVGEKIKSLPSSYIGLDGKDVGSLITSLDGRNENNYMFVLADGAVVSIGGYEVSEKYLSFFLDINGSKGPNQLGKDLFLLYLNSKNNYPVITGPPMWWVGPSTCSPKTVGGWYRGAGCSTWLIKRGNMDYLHRDLTSDEWPSY